MSKSSIRSKGFTHVDVDEKLGPEFSIGIDNYQFGKNLIHMIRLMINTTITIPRLLRLSTMHCPGDLTEKANPCMQIEEYKNKVDYNLIWR